MNARISQDQFDRIYLEDVIPALEHDHELSFLPKDANAKYFNKGICPGCGERTLYISKEKPFQLKCNRLNECQFEEKTRDRYRDLFENLSERFPSTPQNPNATADAYLSDLLPRVDGEWDLPEQIPAKYHKLIGIRALEAQEWTKAIEHLERATALYPKVGVGTRIENARKALNKQQAASGGTE